MSTDREPPTIPILDDAGDYLSGDSRALAPLAERLREALENVRVLLSAGSWCAALSRLLSV